MSANINKTNQVNDAVDKEPKFDSSSHITSTPVKDLQPVVTVILI